MPCGAHYQVGREEDLYGWLEQHVPGPRGEAVLLWLIDFCARPHDHPDARKVGGKQSLRRVAVVPGTGVALELMIVDQYHVVQFLDAWLL